MAEFELIEGVARIPRAEWNALVAEDSPFLEWEWLSSLEEAQTVTSDAGWLARPLVAREAQGLVAACPLYVKGHSEGAFVFDWAWADAAQRAGIPYYPKLLVAVPFTPVAGGRLLTATGVDRSKWLQRMAEALRELCLGNELSGVHVNFCRKDEVETLRESGFLPRVGFQYHWSNRGYETFDDYLAQFRSKRRNQIRREMRSLQREGIEIQTLTGDEIPDALFPKLYELYLSTVDRNPWGRRYLNARLFELLRERFQARLCVVLARQGGEIIAGTINVEKGDTLYGRYWGAFREVRHLHFNVCYYAAVDYCIRRGLRRFEPGAGGSYKQLRGFDAEPTYSAHFLADSRLSKAVARYLEEERAEADEALRLLREGSALKETGESDSGGREVKR
jgi:predicted N-acyltransferase